jgi:subtilisin family serine protease
MKQNVVILRSSPTSVNSDPFAGVFARESVLQPSPMANFMVEEDELEASRFSSVSRHSDVVAIAPSMPMKLIPPVHEVPAASNSVQTAWGVSAVRADTSRFSGDGVVVAVLDTGIDSSHVAFQGVEIVERNFTDEGDGDAHGHGTHCSGTIFGRDVSGRRVGIARGVKKALIGKVLGANGGSSAQLSQAIRWALDHGANVISMSLGFDFPGFVKNLVDRGLPADIATSRGLVGYRANVKLFEALAALVRTSEAITQPAVIVAAAGNESRKNENDDWVVDVAPPAVSDGIISVAALGLAANRKLEAAYFSNRGANIAAPGVGIESAKLGGGIVSMSGTSMATPHVAGVAALWAEMLMQAGRLDALQLTARLLGTATTAPLIAGVTGYEVGLGLVQSPQ